MSTEPQGPLGAGRIREKVIIVMDCYRDPTRWTRADVMENAPYWFECGVGKAAAHEQESGGDAGPLYFFDNATVYTSIDDFDRDRAHEEDHFKRSRASSWLPAANPEDRSDVPRLVTFVPRGWHLQEIDYTTYDRDPRDSVAGAWLFLVKDTVIDAEAALRAAAQTWASEMSAESHGKGFWPPRGQNWGDFIALVREGVLLKHGLVFVDLIRKQGILVDHDETLVPLLSEN